MIASRFRGFLPVVVDIETGGVDARKDALLELALVCLCVDSQGQWQTATEMDFHIEPFAGANLDPASMEINGIRVDHPFRKEIAVPEAEALEQAFSLVQDELNRYDCNRAILVGHNAAFDLGFIRAAAERSKIKKNPFHSFSTLDTVSLAGLMYGQTVLARAISSAGLVWEQEEAHRAIYDARKTAELFCHMVNRWERLCEAD